MCAPGRAGLDGGIIPERSHRRRRADRRLRAGTGHRRHGGDRRHALGPRRHHHTGAIATIAFGEWDGIASPRAEALLGAFENAGVEATLAGDITAAIWSKFVFLSTFSAITCALRLPIGPIREDPAHWSLFRRAMEETFAVAGARSVALDDDLVDQRLAFTEGFAPETYASMYHDLMAGKRIELPWRSGAVVDMGRELGVETPVHENFCQTLKPFVDGKPGGKTAGKVPG